MRAPYPEGTASRAGTAGNTSGAHATYLNTLAPKRTGMMFMKGNSQNILMLQGNLPFLLLGILLISLALFL